MPQVRFVVAGDGAQLEEWKALSHHLNVSESFIFAGKVPFKMAPYFINSYDVCVAPWDVDLLPKVGLSPLKFFDYLSCGKPVIVSPVYGVIELIDTFQCGIICDVKKPEIFAQTIMDLLPDQDRRELLGKTAREVVIKHFTWEITSRKIEKVLGGIA